MKITIDAAGRLVIPKEIRREAGLTPGMTLEVRYREGRVEIEPPPLEIDFVQEGPLVVAVPRRDIEPMRAEDVQRTLEAIREERSSWHQSEA